MSPSSSLSSLAQAARSLRRTPGFTIAAVLILGLALGAVSGLFSMVRHVLLAPLPFAAPERLAYIGGTAPGSSLPGEFGLPREFLVHYGERSRLVEGVAYYNSFTNSLRVGDRVERIEMSAPSASLFSVLGVAPVLGRLPGEGDVESVVAISDRLWADWFGRDPGVIGKQVWLFGAPREVVAVMPPQFHFPRDDTLLWMARHASAADVRKVGSFDSGGLVARLKPGVDEAALAAELTALSKELPQRFGGSSAYADIVAKHRAVVRPLAEQLLGPFAQPIWLLFGAAGAVLLIACANLSNLLLVRAGKRHRELAVRRALGAPRRALLGLQMAEAVCIGLLAGLLAVVLSALALPVLLRAAPPDIPRLDHIGLDAVTLGFTAVVAVFAGALCGLLVALRTASPDLERLRGGGRGLAGSRGGLRQGLVVAQTALGLVLLIGAGLLLRSVQALQAVNPGYDVRDVFTFQFAPEQASLQTAEDWARFHQRFLPRLAALPGVESAGLIENVPLNESTTQVRVRTESSAALPDSGVLVHANYTAGDYFRTLRIGLVSGRLFDAADHEGHGNVLVSRRAAELLWPGRDAIGQRLQRDGQEQWESVVGVVENVLQNSFAEPPEAVIYLPLLGPDPSTSVSLGSPAYVVRSARAGGIAADVRALIREVAPEAPMYRQFTMEQLAADSMRQLRFTLLTLGIAAAMALVMLAAGLLASFLPARRAARLDPVESLRRE